MYYHDYIGFNYKLYKEALDPSKEKNNVKEN